MMAEITIPANTYFSTISQAAADQLAIDAAEAQCPSCLPAIDGTFNWTVTDDIVASGGGSTTYDTVGMGPLSYVTVTDAKVGSPAFPFISQTEVTSGEIIATADGSCLVTIEVTETLGTTADNNLGAVVRKNGSPIDSHFQTSVGTGTISFSYVSGNTIEIVLYSQAGLYDDAVTVSYGEIHGTFTIGNP